MHFFFFTQLWLLTSTPQYLICICLQTTLLLLEYKSVKVSYADANDAKMSEDTPLMTFSLFLPCSLSPWSVWIWPHVKKEPWCCLLKALLTDQPLLHFKTNWSWCIYLGSDIFKLFLMHHSSANNIKQIWSICDAVSQALDLWPVETRICTYINTQQNCYSHCIYITNVLSCLKAKQSENKFCHCCSFSPMLHC